MGATSAVRPEPDHEAVPAARRQVPNAGVVMLFATAPPRTPLPRGRSVLATLVLHAGMLLPLAITVARYGAPPALVAEAEGIVFVEMPVRGAGSPSPREAPLPDAPPAPVVTDSPVDTHEETPPDERPTETSPVVPLVAPSSLLAPRPQLGSIPTPATAMSAETPASRGSDVGSGPGGHGSSALAPAIGTLGERSNWTGLVLGRLEQFRRYPAAARRARQEGVAQVRFTIDRSGRVLAASLARTSGQALLDKEAVALVRRAAPLPAPPPELAGETITLTVPVEFFLSR